ncbi:MAG: hypothetical protein ACI9OJ_002226 [Myxococcota bacterium]|jgi:hypothetical protein
MPILYLLMLYEMFLPLAGLWATLSLSPVYGAWTVGLGFFPVILLIGITPAAIEVPHHPLRASLLVLLVPVEIAIDCLWLGSSARFYLLEALFIHVVSGGVAVFLRVLDEKPVDGLSLFWSGMLTLCGVAAFGGAMLEVYSELPAIHWAYLGVILLSGVLSWGAFVANSRNLRLGRSRARVRKAPLTRLMDRAWPDTNAPFSLHDPAPWVTGGVMLGIVVWVVLALVML